MKEERTKYTNFKELPRSGSIMPSYNKNGIEVDYYGGELCAIYIDGKNIEDMFEIPECRGMDDELIYRITDEATAYVLNEINKREGRDLDPQ